MITKAHVLQLLSQAMTKETLLSELGGREPRHKRRLDKIIKSLLKSKAIVQIIVGHELYYESNRSTPGVN